MENFAGYEISINIKDELIKNLEPKKEEKANDKEFINRYIILLMKREDIDKNVPNQNFNI